MAVCDYCDQEMNDYVACTQATYNDFPDGVERERIPYPPNGDTSYPPNCRDCGTPQDGLHHPGCCVERCPKCKFQAISCECAPNEEDEP